MTLNKNLYTCYLIFDSYIFDNLNIYIPHTESRFRYHSFLVCDLVGFEFIVALNRVANLEIYLDKKDGLKAFFEDLTAPDSEIFGTVYYI